MAHINLEFNWQHTKEHYPLALQINAKNENIQTDDLFEIGRMVLLYEYMYIYRISTHRIGYSVAKNGKYAMKSQSGWNEYPYWMPTNNHSS